MLSLSLCAFFLVGGHYLFNAFDDEGWNADMRMLFPQGALSYETEAEFAQRIAIGRICTSRGVALKTCTRIYGSMMKSKVYIHQIVLRRPLTRSEVEKTGLC